MANFLESIGYNTWVLPALLLIPLVAAVIILLVPARDPGETGGVESPRRASARLLVLRHRVPRLARPLVVVQPGGHGLAGKSSTFHGFRRGAFALRSASTASR